MNALLPMNETRIHLADKLQFEVGQHSVAGSKDQNEDAIGIRIPDGNLLATKGAAAVIADGVSTAEAGREASHTCVSNFLSDYFSTPEPWSVKQSAQQVLTALNRWLYGRGQGLHDNRGYITTMSTVVFKSHTAHIFHVGDSRVYRLRDGSLELLTQDHSTRVSDNHAYLARALGLDVRLDVDYLAVPLQRGDLFLQTTDGVHDVLDFEAIQQLLGEEACSLPELCQHMVAAALDAGSTDNLSCQVLRITGLPDARVDEVIDRLTELRFPPFLEEGMILDGYRVLRELHASARSQVYLVEDTSSGEHYCMKTPSVNFEDDPAYIERFIMESWIGARVNSPHVVRVVDPARPKSCLYYLTEYIDGMTLTQWMRENPQPPVQEAVFLLDQVARGVRALHRRETLHQDIKPDNILIDSNGRVKVVDFGSCHVAGIAEITTPLQRDFAVGTASYSAPEHALGRKVGYAADLFSLAVISYEVLTGKLPFGGKLENCKRERDFHSLSYTATYKLNPLVPTWIDSAIRKALQICEDNRHGDISEFAYELQHPNPDYLEYHRRPLVQRDPLKTWKYLCAALALGQLITLILLLN